MAELADALVKGGFGAVGVVASAYTLAKFIVSTPVKIEDRNDLEHGMDLVLIFDSEAYSPSVIEYFVSTLKHQSRLTIREKPTVKHGADSNILGDPEKETHYLVGATPEVLARIRARKEKAIHAANTDKLGQQAFTSGERIELLVFELNRLCAFPPPHSTEASIPKPFQENDPLLAQALHSRLLKEYFPVHDDKERHELVETWVKQWRTAQPLNAVRAYFGDEIGFYFAFLEMYSRWLVVPTAVGLLVFAIEVSSEYGAYGRAFYSLFITSWATAFLKFWKRRQNTLKSEWDIAPADGLALEQERPDFSGERRYDPVEDRHFTYFSSMHRMRRYLATSLVTLGVLAVILQLMFAYFQVELWFAQELTPAKGWDGYYEYASFLPSVGYSIVVLLLDMKYRDLAASLTKYENHRTDADFANALVLKLASFYFVNNFGSLFFLAFRARNMEQLQQTLSSLLITRQLIGNIQEQLIPYFTATSSLKTEAGKLAKESHNPNAVLSKVDAELLFPTYDGTFDDYLELFVQFGQVTLFASAYPLAALWSLANNVMEIRSDAFKLCVSFRRSRRVPCDGIGTWLYAFNALGYLSVMTNCAIFGLHSGMLDKLFPSLTFASLLVTIAFMEHLMLGVKVCIEMFVPDVPSSVLEDQRMERATLRKKAMLQIELSSRKLQLENDDAPASEPTVQLDEADRLRASSPERMMMWIRQEKERRAKLEQELKNLNDLYMGWIREEQEKRRTAEQKVNELLKSTEQTPKTE